MGKREDNEAKTEKLIMPIVEANNVELFDVPAGRGAAAAGGLRTAGSRHHHR